MEPIPLRRSPLHDRHEVLGAKFSEFGGWSMPMQYSGVLAEHEAVRERVGIFDVSHLGKIAVTGQGAVDFLNGVLTNDLGKLGPGAAQYTMLLNDDAGVIDDLIAYYNSPEDVFLVPNAGNNAEVAANLASLAPEGVKVDNQHEAFAVIAVQGPSAAEVMSAVGLPVNHDYMRFAWVDAPVRASVCRTGYTGERGYEVVCAADDAGAIWDALMTLGEGLGIRACGLGARDTLRTEMGYALHGHEISPTIDPVSAGLSWAIGWGKPEFRGHERCRQIKADGPLVSTRGLLAKGRAIARPGMVVVGTDGNEIGVVTSGTFSPTLKKGIALALVEGVALGDEVGVQVRQRTESFEVVKPPFVRASVR